MIKYPTLKGDDGKPFTIKVNKFGKGVMSLFDDTRLPIDAVADATNMWLDQDGVWTVRPGTAMYGATLETPVDGGGSFVKYNSNGTTDTYTWVIDNGKFKYSQDGGSWTHITGKTWTTNKPVYGKQIKSRLYLGNGTDAMAYYDIDSDSIVTFTALNTPAAPSLARVGLSTGPYNAYYKITAINEIGETLASSEGSVSGGINKQRDNWILGTDSITVTITRISGATRYNIYYSDQSGSQVYLDSMADVGSGGTQDYSDTGAATPNPYAELPESDTTGGPKYAYLSLSGNRLWGTKDPNLPYRVGWTGTGQYLGAFNPFYGGGYIDLNKGGSERPEVITHFRDGRGNAVATVLTSTPDGAGSTWHVSLSTLTVDTINIVVPQAYQQQGSVGTRSPRGVIEYDNSVYFPSPKGFHSLGSAQQILNVLVTDEISSNVRPSVLGINNANADKIAGFASRGRLYWSVPFGSTSNNQTWVFDIERRGVWNLQWSVGVKQFFEYTDSGGRIRLLGVPVTGTKLIEFDDETLGDSGEALNTNLESGLIHWDEDHTTWARIDKVYVELANPKGAVTFTISGTQKGKNFRSIGSITITDEVSNAGIGADLLGDFLLGDSNETPTTFSQSSKKKRIRINKLLNNLRWQFTSSSINTRYTVMQVIIKGTILPTSDPSDFKV